MRKPRALLQGQEAFYHCMSRCVGGLHLFTAREREEFRRRLRKQADFSQMTIKTDTCLSNHFHFVVEVPSKVELSDTKLFRVIRRYYGAEHLKTLEFAKAMEHPEAEVFKQLRAQYLARMGNLSIFMKELKEGFSKWFNAAHDRYGTLWAERFTSVIVCEGSEALVKVAAYIDLNSVRAGMVGVPEDYPYCGFAEALARAGPARDGLASILPGDTWEEKLAYYRMILYGKGAVAKNEKQATLDPKKVLEVFRAGGKLTLSEALLLKVRYFSEGIAVGTAEFVTEIFEKCRQKYCQKLKRAGSPMKGADWGGLICLKSIKDPIEPPAQQQA